MKKNLLSVIALSAILSTASFATSYESLDKETSIVLGIGGSGISGLTLSTKFYSPVKAFGGIGFGLGIDIGTFEESESEELGYIFDVYPTIKYTLSNGIAFDAMVGYTVGTVANTSIGDLTYGVGTEFKVNNDISIGLNWKRTDIDFDFTDKAVDRFQVAFKHKF